VTALHRYGGEQRDVSFSFVPPQVAVNSQHQPSSSKRADESRQRDRPDPTRGHRRDDDPARRPPRKAELHHSFEAFGPRRVLSATSPGHRLASSTSTAFRLGQRGALNRYVYDLQFEYIGGIPSNVFPTPWPRDS